MEAFHFFGTYFNQSARSNVPEHSSLYKQSCKNPNLSTLTLLGEVFSAK